MSLQHKSKEELANLLNMFLGQSYETSLKYITEVSECEASTCIAYINNRCDEMNKRASLIKQLCAKKELTERESYIIILNAGVENIYKYLFCTEYDGDCFRVSPNLLKKDEPAFIDITGIETFNLFHHRLRRTITPNPLSLYHKK